MADQLSLYNAALLNCGERFLATLSDNVEPRRLLDQAWADGAVDACLEQGQWYFAMRATRLDYDPSIAPQWGYSRAFQKPTDWVLSSAVCEDEFFRAPLLRYFDEAGYWYCDLDSIYVRYVSNDTLYGGAIGKWPKSFYDFVAAFLASKIVFKLANDAGVRDRVIKLSIKLKKDAKNRAAMVGPTMFPAQGAWSRARQGSRGGLDNGTGGSGPLIG